MMNRVDVHSSCSGMSNVDGDAPVAAVDKLINQQGTKHHGNKVKLK